MPYYDCTKRKIYEFPDGRCFTFPPSAVAKQCRSCKCLGLECMPHNDDDNGNQYDCSGYSEFIPCIIIEE